jgi:hypothetical protein
MGFWGDRFRLIPEDDLGLVNALSSDGCDGDLRGIGVGEGGRGGSELYTRCRVRVCIFINILGSCDVKEEAYP